MFGGGNGSFGVAPPPNPFGGSVQASPVNPFQGSGGFGGPASGGGGFGGDSTSFGGRGGGRSGGRNSFAGRGGRAPSRGGGRSGGRNGPPYQGNTFGAPAAGFGGGGGRGAPAATTSSFDNPFASPAPSPGGFGGQSSAPSPATSFGRGGGRNGGRAAGRDGAGRGTTFGGAATVQPNIRRRSDVGGRGGPRSLNTTFGQGGAGAAFVPPLPPSSPPPMGPPVTRKPGRGGIVTPSASPSPMAVPVTTAFGQQSNGRAKGRIELSAGAPLDSSNPFGGSTSSASSRTTFGARNTTVNDSFDAFSRPVREKRASNTFPQPSQESNAFEARMTGAKVRNNQAFQSISDQGEEHTVFGHNARNKPTAFTSEVLDGGVSTMAPTLKPKKKILRSTPQASPPSTPAPVSGSGDYQVIGDQKNKAELASAENLDGTCIDMCSPSERELHIRVDELSLFEKCFPGQPGQERELIVKRFQRSSADHKLDIPSELRPLGVLRRTQLYLEQQIMDRERLGPDSRFSPPRLPELIELYNFCWDRCRMIRKDFVLQNYRGAGGRVHPIAIDVHERIARYHILSEHELCEVPSFVAQQNMEQLGQTLKSLNELYDESRKLSDPAYLSPFEAEFRGYFILCTLDNGRGSDVLKFVKGLAPQVREASQVKFAMQVFVARHTQNYCLFFKLLRQATYLQACLVFRYIPSMRSLALERLNRAHRNQPYPLGDLVELLCFDDFEHAESVCVQHGLDISASEDSDGDGDSVVNFGGDFESDIQLRQNKNPLPVRASYVYISQKQGDFLRGEVCRGVTEYAQEDYPALSKLIEDTENAERAAMYPDRPPMEDEYSAFAVYASDPYDIGDLSESVNGHNKSSFSSHQPRSMPSVDVDERQHELNEIARKKAEVERTKIMMMERIQQLEREKEEKKRRAADSETAVKVAAGREADEKAHAEAEIARKQLEAQQKLKAEEEARKQKQIQLEAEERQRALAAKAAAEQARLAEARRVAEEKRQAEEEHKRRELQKLEDERRRKAAAEAERRRQLELAAERERLELEAKRQAQLAMEAARRKKLRRIKKEQLAVMKLRLHVWRKFVRQSKTLPQDVKMETSMLIEQNENKPADVMEWLFGGPRTASDFIGLQRRKLDLHSLEDNDYSITPTNIWHPINVGSVVGRSLRAPTRQASGWKFVVADLLDDGLSSFGSWCAVKYGIASASIDDDDNVSSVHSTQWSDAFNLGVCCRFLGATFLRSLSVQGREKRLAGTSAIVLPLDLGYALDSHKLRNWYDRVREVLSHLHPSRKVGVVVLGYISSRNARRGDALAAAESAIKRLLVECQEKVAFIDGEIIFEDELISSASVNEKIAGVLAKLAHSSSPQSGRLVVDLSDVMEAVVQSTLQDRGDVTESALDVQDRLHKQLWRLRDALLSPSVLDIDAPIPELQATLNVPAYGWNSREAQQRWDAIFKVLTSHKVVVEDDLLAPSKVCEVFFEQISHLVDAVFSRIPSGILSTSELKQSLYGLLVPIHDELLKKGESKIRDASRILPWRQMFTHIYGACIECIDEELVYVPVKLMEAFEHRPDLGRTTQINETPARKPRLKSGLDASAQAAVVAFARHELKRALNGYAVPATQVSSIKRLRREIVRDKAASQNFKQYLRRELDRWSTPDAESLLS